MAPMNFISRNEPSWKKWIEANVCWIKTNITQW
jgi:hypothetical protein